MVKTQIRTILVRARSVDEARKFAKLSHKKLGTMDYLPETIVSVRLNKKVGLAGGVKGYNVTLKRRPDRRKRDKFGGLISARKK